MDYFKENLIQIREFILRENSDWVFVNTGEEGAGKSYLGLRALAILGVKAKNLRKHVGMNVYEFVKLVKKHRDEESKGVPIMMDEPTDLINREAMKELNVLLIKTFIFSRSLNQIHILNIPNFYWLDPYLRKHRIKTMWYSAYDLKRKIRIHGWYGKRELAYLNSQRAKNRLDFLLSKGEEFLRKVRPKFLFNWDVNELGKDLIHEYEELKKEFQGTFLEDVEMRALGNAVADFNSVYIKELKKNEDFLKRVGLVSIMLKLSEKFDSREVWDILIREEGYEKDFIIDTFRLMRKLKLAKISIEDRHFKIQYSPMFHYFEDVAKAKGFASSEYLKKEKEEKKKIEEAIKKAKKRAFMAEKEKTLSIIEPSKIKRWIYVFAFNLNGYVSQQLIKKLRFNGKGSGSYIDALKSMLVEGTIREVSADEIELDFLKKHNVVYELTEEGLKIAEKLDNSLSS